MAAKKRVLFICTANSARSQIAEALLRDARPEYEVFSAGTQPAEVDQIALSVLEQMNVTTADLYSKSLDDFRPDSFDYVIALCDKAHAECRALAGAGEFMAWDFDDPQERGTHAAYMKAAKEIQQRIHMFLLVTEKGC